MRSNQGVGLEERIVSMEKELKFMEAKKNEAINKLAQVMRSTDRSCRDIFEKNMCIINGVGFMAVILFHLCKCT